MIFLNIIFIGEPNIQNTYIKDNKGLYWHTISFNIFSYFTQIYVKGLGFVGRNQFSWNLSFIDKYTDILRQTVSFNYTNKTNRIANLLLIACGKLSTAMLLILINIKCIN